MLFPDRLPRAHARRAPVRAGRPVDRQECDGRRGMTTPRLNFHTPALRQKRKHSSGRVGRSTPGNPDVCHSSRGPARLPTSEPGAGPSDRCSLLFSPPGGRRYAGDVARSVLQQIHNPRNRECGCDPDCWCSRTSLGRLVKWWFPARLIGLHHKNDAVAAWKQDRDPGR